MHRNVAVLLSIMPCRVAGVVIKGADVSTLYKIQPPGLGQSAVDTPI